MSSEPDDRATSPAASRAVDAALAEFAALRAEIAGYINTQAALIGITLTAFGVILGIVFAKDGDSRIAAAIPFLSFLVMLLYASASYKTDKVGRYIEIELWPFIRSQVGDALPSWQSRARITRREVLLGVPLQSAVVILLVGTSIFSLVFAGRTMPPSILTAAIVATALTAIVATITAFATFLHETKVRRVRFTSEASRAAQS